MASIFVNWNPRLHSWVAHPSPAQVVRRISIGWQPLISWTARDTSRVATGDTVYFMLHNEGAPVGILGSGSVAGEPVMGESWDAARPGETAYIPIGLTAMVGVRHALLVGDVAPLLPGGQWPTVASGVPIPPEFEVTIAAEWERHWQSVLHRACPFCGSAHVVIEAVPPITDSAHRCGTCGYLWGSHLDESIVSGPDDLPAVMGCRLHELQEDLRELREDPDLTVIRNDAEALVLNTSEGEVVWTYPFLGEPFVEIARRAWQPWIADDEPDGE